MKENFFVHSTSVVDTPCEIGDGTKIWHFSHIMQNCQIGKDCNIGQNVVISPNVKIGNGVKIQNNVSVYSGVICEDDVFLGPSCVFTNVINPRAFIEKKHEFKETRIKKGASIGANATVICGIEIGIYALVGAGSLITRDVPDYAIVYGVPAKVKGYVCKCGEKLHFVSKRAECKLCHTKYLEENNKIREVIK